MILAKIAMIILVTTIVLTLSTKIMWFFFLLFGYRAIASIVSFEWAQSVGIENHLIYFVIILMLTLLFYGLLLKLTLDLPLVRYAVLAIVVFYVFTQYSFAEIFLFKDYFEYKDLWNVDFYVEQIKELFGMGIDGFSEFFSIIPEAFMKIFGGILDAIIEFLS